MKFLSKNVEETNKIAQDFLQNLKANKNKATLVGLFGDLGSGKTTFTQAVGRELGITDFITSPTFVIEKIYQLDGKFNFKNLIHIDAYRLDSGRELQVLGFEEILKDSQNLILLEWPERVIDILPTDLVKLNFKFISENEREIEVL
ncbi:MAG: tRNA (adenosine(37)-N6)-threonylcarbamoyltransferase complex ATPase subunit type 1 TsaE [Candidatus Paceibacterota bacterium]